LEIPEINGWIRLSEISYVTDMLNVSQDQYVRYKNSNVYAKINYETLN
jgi:hypothetical protein